jgi:hypothetical protein
VVSQAEEHTVEHTVIFYTVIFYTVEHTVTVYTVLCAVEVPGGSATVLCAVIHCDLS